ncbi:MULTISPECIES: hypothetical protein [unclassified Dyella]|jgi:hypothetical protein|uniref:hypothetical protein n=1 Tax=unclassified Dyella TaxID=2634549 RepID=UPI003F8FFEBC
MRASPVLVHYHIFKNAGTSIDECLRHSFGECWGAYEGPHAHAIQSSEQLAAHLQANPQLAAVSSHLARPPVPTPNCLPIAFIRHPLLRAYSVYRFTRQCPSQPFSDVALATGFDGYIRWALRKEPGSIVIRDYQVVHLSDASWRCDHILDARALPEDLEQARALISSWGVVGVVEQFDLSIQTYQALYGPQMPKLVLMPCRENCTTGGRASTEERVEALKQLLGQDLHDQFMAANRLDLALHAHATHVLQQAGRRLDLPRLD